jgi:predicted nucleotidyltransferase
VEGRLKAYLEEAAARLKGAFTLEGVHLFGSWARGSADLDLRVVARTDLPPLERIGGVLELLQDSPWPVEALVLIPEELRERKNAKGAQRG